MSALSDTYAAQFHACSVKTEHAAEVQSEAERIRAHRQRYAAVAAHFPGMPWWVVGILHSMECGLSFHQHLHHGEPVSARTVQAPGGHPEDGRPSITWEESARDALMGNGLDQITDWSPGHALAAFEQFNGTGYRRRGVPSPYLWSFTDQYRCGMYAADGHYDPLAVSRQPPVRLRSTAEKSFLIRLLTIRIRTQYHSMLSFNTAPRTFIKANGATRQQHCPFAAGKALTTAQEYGSTQDVSHPDGLTTPIPAAA